MVRAGNDANRIINIQLDKDLFNDENESFLREEKLTENEFSVNIPTLCYYRGKNPEWVGKRGQSVPDRNDTGYTGVGQDLRRGQQLHPAAHSEGVCHVHLRWHRPPGSNSLFTIAYNYPLQHQGEYEVKPKFLVTVAPATRFDDPRRSPRCNPLSPEGMTDIVAAQESAQTILLNLNKT